jgi:hypothetical protein
MIKQELNKSYSNLLNDINFDWLELESSRPNLFNILGATHNELRHSNILAWLMTPSESHTIGEAFLKRFLREVAQDEKTNLSQLAVEKLHYDEVEIRREWNNIDLLVIFPNHVIVIENKIWSKETGNQLERYKKIAEEHFSDQEKSYVFLTPHGYESSYETETYVSISYRVVIDSLTRIKEIKSAELTKRTDLLIEDYVKILRRNIMNDDEAVELAQEIYKNHKELFDFVYEHKPDLSESLKPPIEEFVTNKGWLLGSRNKGYVRFTTPTIAEIMKPYGKGGWPDNEVMLFEVDYWWSSGLDNTRIFFKLVISPGDNDELKGELQKIIEERPQAGKPSGTKWLTYFLKKLKYKWEKVEEDPENLRTYLKNMEDHIEKTVTEVEKAVVENAARLKELQN